MRKTASILVGLVALIAVTGAIMLASASEVQGEARYHNAGFFVLRQLVWLTLAGLACWGASRLDYHRLRWAAVPLVAVTAVLLILCLVPGVGLKINGSRRWLTAGIANFQPSELAKIAVIVFLAWWMKRAERRVATLRDGVLIPFTVLGILLGLIFIEPDYGTTMLIASVGMAILFLGGTRVGYLALIATGGACLFAYAVMREPEHMRRILAFLNPERYAEDEAFQLIQGLYAFVLGGAGGAGYGQSIQKLHYLPEAHTDFILPIVGEEIGLAGTLGYLLGYVGIFICGLLIVLRAPDLFGRLLAFGITLMLTLQAMINIGVVTGCLPTKGLALPFISYGGSSLLISGAMVGILVNIARHAGGGVADDHTKLIKDRLRRI